MSVKVGDYVTLRENAYDIPTDNHFAPGVRAQVEEISERGGVAETLYSLKLVDSESYKDSTFSFYRREFKVEGE
jgi:hypothetical protein